MNRLLISIATLLVAGFIGSVPVLAAVSQFQYLPF